MDVMYYVRMRYLCFDVGILADGACTTSIGGCRAENEPGHGGLSTNETFILWVKFNSLSHFFPHGSKVYPGIALVCPGLQPPMVTSSLNCTGLGQFTLVQG